MIKQLQPSCDMLGLSQPAVSNQIRQLEQALESHCLNTLVDSYTARYSQTFAKCIHAR
ncbi:LysR family transcriptional regulator [Marinomonas shanghaiensis]|uniref:LysR family transcriptional regulator n=1 Tax=Marinomonas shanghaiensis TaxID=2202418 RepID=UPI003A8D4836